MSYADNMYILGNISNLLGSTVTYMEQRKAGVDPMYAGANLFQNLGNGIVRNNIAYGMQRWGNPIGNNINLAYGYGNPWSNTCASMALMTACTPWMFFNSPYCGMGMYGCGMYGGMGMMPHGFGGGFGYGFHPGFWC